MSFCLYQFRDSNNEIQIQKFTLKILFKDNMYYLEANIEFLNFQSIKVSRWVCILEIYS